MEKAQGEQARTSQNYFITVSSENCNILTVTFLFVSAGSDGPQNKSHAKLTDNHSPTSHTSPSPTSTTHPSTNSSVNTEIIMSPSTNHSTSNQSTPSLPSSTTLSNQTTQNTINTSTATVAPTITPATNTTLATKAITQPSSTSSSSNQTTTSEFDGQPRASSNLPPNVTIIPSSSTSTHVDNPSQLNVEGDSKCITLCWYIKLFLTIHCQDIDRASSELS